MHRQLRPGLRARSRAGRRRARSAARSPRRPTGSHPRARRSSADGEARARARSGAGRAACAARAGVGDESPLVLEGRLEPLEHLVERLGEPRDLVARRRYRQPAARSRRRDRARLAPHRLDRPKRGAREQVPAERREQQRERRARGAAPGGDPRATPPVRRARSRARARSPALPERGIASSRQRPEWPGIDTVARTEPPPATIRAWLAVRSAGRPAGSESDTAPRPESTWAKLTPLSDSLSTGGRPLSSRSVAAVALASRVWSAERSSVELTRT